jgi:undecaprenyl-phosphate galactose phosphotransferase
MELVEKPRYELAKRLLETLLAIIVLLLLSPLWLAVALAIKLTSAGPVLYRGQVAGKNGRIFTYYKFRSMYANRDDTPHRAFITDYVGQYLNPPVGLRATRTEGRRVQYAPKIIAFEAQEHLPPCKLLNDNRVTPVGRLIRKLSIDEIPQLLNVIRGEMAIVGPRPPVLYEYHLYDEWCCQRLTVRPGITGLAQVRGRGTASFSQMLELDLEYIQKRSLWLDIKILLKTPIAMLKGA